jgi:hypothetical protein
VRLPDGNGVFLAKMLRAGGCAPNILLTSTDREAVTPNQLRESESRRLRPEDRDRAA